MSGFIGQNFGANASSAEASLVVPCEERIPVLVRGDNQLVEHEIEAIDDDANIGDYTTVFGIFNHQYGAGAEATGTCVVSDTSGKWKMRTTLAGASTLPLKFGSGYKWTHSIINQAGSIMTKLYGDTRLLDGYAVDRLAE